MFRISATAIFQQATIVVACLGWLLVTLYEGSARAAMESACAVNEEKTTVAGTILERQRA